MKSDSTTIKLSKKTKERLDNFREYKRESYEEILEKIFGVLNTCRINPQNARMKLFKINNRKKENSIRIEKTDPNAY
ncbi:MAG: hypothetical protein AABX85_01420 [Nanoarchaeota archaeon]